MSDVMFQPTPPPALPHGVKLRSSEIRVARKSHVLDCGCRVESGWPYYRLCVKINNQLVYWKRHVFRCPNDKKPTLLGRN